MEEAQWYVAHTDAGYENKVKVDIEKTIENRHLEDQILEVTVPLQDVERVKNGQIQQAQEKVFPGYVLLHMVMNDDTWYVVRNTRGVTGFVGPGSKPVPLTEAEVRSMGLVSSGESKSVPVQVDFEVGDTVIVTAGAWADRESTVQAINPAKHTVTIYVDVFGRETAVELDFTQVKKK